MNIKETISKLESLNGDDGTMEYMLDALADAVIMICKKLQKDDKK